MRINTSAFAIKYSESRDELIRCSTIKDYWGVIYGVDKNEGIFMDLWIVVGTIQSV